MMALENVGARPLLSRGVATATASVARARPVVHAAWP